MRKVLLCALLFMGYCASSQNFDQFFNNQTLRIDYLHIGNFDGANIEVKTYHAGGVWSGTRHYLIEEQRYGDIKLEVYDSISNQLIYAKSYSSLFNEYRTTERGRKEVGEFEESVTMPLPKQTVRYAITVFDRENVGTTLLTQYYNPKTTPTQAFKREYPVVKLHQGGKPENCMDILLIPDGYTKDEEKLMMNDLKRFASYITNCSPYKERLKDLNIRAIKCFSEQSGITDPNRGFEANTILNSSYNVLDIDRYLMCLNVWEMNAIADDAPYDFIIILANAPKYGGGGIYNFYATVNNQSPESDYVIVHEMGHLIGGLGDEYYTSETSVQDYYPQGIEPVEPNLTTLVDFKSKWVDMMDPNTPIPTPAVGMKPNVLGVYEGGGYVAEGVYRPWLNCTMKEIIYNNYCPVCTRTLVRAIDYFSNK